MVLRFCCFACDYVRQLVDRIANSIFVVGAVIALIAEAFGEVSIDVSAVEVVMGAVAWIAVFDGYLIGFWWLAGQTPGMPSSEST